jgi:acetolactate synthase-1/2/3 large subunit
MNNMAPTISDTSAAALVARFLKARGVDRVFALCGGHIMPLWMRIDAEGIRLIDVRDERAAVYMAHAHAEMTGGLGVAMVTAGPGVTNAMTGIANAYVSKAPVLVLSGTPPQLQENRGALQDMIHTDFVRPLTRYARTVRQPELVLQELDEAVSRAFGQGGEPGPVYLDFPVDTLRGEVPRALVLPEQLEGRPRDRMMPDPAAVQRAVDLLLAAKRPLFISGRGARGAGPQLAKLLDRLDALYLDTGESRGLVPDDHRSVVAAMRGSVLTEADLVVTVGRRLDFQLAYGSPAIFGDAKFVRIADIAGELRDNRRGAAEIFATPSAALDAILAATEGRKGAAGGDWARTARAKHLERAKKLVASMKDAPPGKDGLMHPNRLVAALRDALPDDAVIVADGGDFLSFARVGLPATTYLDPGLAGLHRRRHTVRHRGEPGAARPRHGGGHRRRLVRLQRDGDRHRGAPQGAAAHRRRQQRQLGDRGARPARNARQGGRHALAVLGLCGDGARIRLHGERIERAEDLPAAIERALANRPALLDVLVTPDAVSSDAKSGLAWVPDLQALGTWDDAERKWRAS